MVRILFFGICLQNLVNSTIILQISGLVAGGAGRFRPDGHVGTEHARREERQTSGHPSRLRRAHFRERSGHSRTGIARRVPALHRAHLPAQSRRRRLLQPEGHRHRMGQTQPPSVFHISSDFQYFLCHFIELEKQKYPYFFFSSANEIEFVLSTLKVSWLPVNVLAALGV